MTRFHSAYEFIELVFLDFKLYNLERRVNYLTLEEIYLFSLSEAEAFSTEYLYKAMFGTDNNSNGETTAREKLSELEKNGIIVDYDNTVFINDIDVNSLVPFEIAESHRKSIEHQELFSKIINGEITAQQAEEMLESDEYISNISDSNDTDYNSVENADNSQYNIDSEEIENVNDEEFLKAFEDGLDNKYIKQEIESVSINHELIKEYIKNIQLKTGIDLHVVQKNQLKNALRNKKYVKLNAKQTAIHRQKFDKVKNKLISQWEEKTGQVWPRYTENIFANGTEKIIRKIGDYYDAHHIIENSFGGEHEWWNIHPAKFPSEHQLGIHGKDSPANKIFK